MELDIDDSRFDLVRTPGRALPDTIADKLRELVESGLYPPGRRLHSEAELTGRWRVARSSVRTALQRLEATGILESRHGRGWYVRRTPQPDPAILSGLHEGRYRLGDLFELRISLEGLAASLAAVRASPGEAEDISKLNKQHLDAGEDQDELLGTDRDFHEAIVVTARNELLIATYRDLIGELDDWRRRSFHRAGVSLRSGREHAKVIRYLRNRDAGGARMAMNSHLQPLYDEIVDIEFAPLDTSHNGQENEPEWHDRDRRG